MLSAGSREIDNVASGAHYCIEGIVRVAGERVRCNVQLVETIDGHHLWAEKFDGLVEEIFNFQDRITEEVVAGLEVELSEGQQARTWRREAGDALAYDAFLSGRAAYKEYSRPGNARARAAFETALERSPTFLAAAVGLARTHNEDATFGWSTNRDESLREARRVLNGVFAIAGSQPTTMYLLPSDAQNFMSACRSGCGFSFMLRPPQAYATHRQV